MNKIAVIGDAILDIKYNLSKKINPEISSPLFLVDKGICTPGGSANICNHLINFEIDFDYFGLLDSQTFSCLDSNFNAFNSVVFQNAIRNPIKKRYYEDDNYLFRIDEELINYGLNKKLLNYYQFNLIKNIKQQDYKIAIFSDYNKGLFNEIDVESYIQSLNKDCLKIVDPKKGPVSKWHGCDIIKPNHIEAKELSCGKEDWKEQASFIQKETGAKSVIITQAGDGVVGIINKEFFEIRPEEKIEVKSVVGAGDCFMALLSFSLFENNSIYDSIKYAFRGSSKFVKDNKILHPLDLYEKKYIDPHELKNRNFTLCFTNGCFDILHLGHIELLKFAKSKADKLVVALNTDKSVLSQNKSHSLVNDLETRIKTIESLEFVDYVVDFNQTTPYEVIKIIKPDVLVKGDEYENPIGSDLVKKVEKFRMIEGFSTTNYINKIKNS